MEKKRYKIKSACPQCGCSYLTTLSAEEIKAKYPDVENVDLECGECMLQFETKMADACPEWDNECKLNEQKHLKKVFWLNLGVGRSVQILEIPDVFLRFEPRGRLDLEPKSVF